jgi:hypothetical protein
MVVTSYIFLNKKNVPTAVIKAHTENAAIAAFIPDSKITATHNMVIMKYNPPRIPGKTSTKVLIVTSV